jgi:membrane protein YdbS with pleckstrin-like domain
MNEIVTEKNYPIQTRWILKSILGYLFVLLLYGPFMLIGMFNQKNNEVPSTIVSIFFLVIAIIFILFNTILIFLRRKTFHYSIEDKFLTLKQGIISRQQRHIPYGVIQNIFVKQNLLDRFFGLASLTIENASQGAGTLVVPQGQKFFGMRVGSGFRIGQRTEMGQQTEPIGSLGNAVSIPGLKKQNAEILKEIVLQKMKENPIEDNQSGL